MPCSDRGRRLDRSSSHAAAAVRCRTLTAPNKRRGTPASTWLGNLDRALDEAVAAAYGWPADFADDDLLARLLAENQARGGPIR